MKLLQCPFSEASFAYQELATSKGFVIICAGGAYAWRSPREQEPVAKAFLAQGFSVAILNYTVGENLGKLPMEEASWVIQTLRERDKTKDIILLGFSAGAHLAASVGVHHLDLHLARPDMLVLSYPVLVTGKHSHEESIRRLGTIKEKTYHSLEKWVGVHTPPTFLWHTADDPDVPVENSLLFAQALAKKKVPFELHIYPFGVHGLSLATQEVEEAEKGRLSNAHVATWFELCIQWLEEIHTSSKTYEKREDNYDTLEK